MSNDKQNLWDRINSNPLVPGFLLAWWIWRCIERDWNITWVTWLGMGIFALWFLGTFGNWLSNGRLGEWFDSLGESEFRVPDTFNQFKKEFKVETPLMEVIEKGMSGDTKLESILAEVEIEAVETVDEAIGALSAYKELCDQDDAHASHLAYLFRIPGSAEVFGFFYHFGMPIVHERYNAIRDRQEDEEDFDREDFKLLALLSGFAYRPAFSDFAAASRDDRLTESYMWGTIFDAGNEGDEDFIELLQSLGKSLPEGFACVAYLDRCNALALEDEIDPHPFSTDMGTARLVEYFTDDDTEHFSYAVSAAVALPFLSHPRRDELMALAAGHPSPNVIVETAWAGAKVGKSEFVRQLAELTRDWKTGGRALEYLQELELQDEIPEESRDDRHMARCAMADWLQHPNELGKLPDSLEIVDHREIYWPPCEDTRAVTLLKWRKGEKEGIGMTGGTTTWCFFSQDHVGAPPLEVLARPLQLGDARE